MRSPRLRGPYLRAALRLLDTAPGLALARRHTFAAYGMDALERVDLRTLEHIDHEPRPVSAGLPKQWAAADLPPPTPSRTSCADLTAAYRAGETTPLEVLGAIRAHVEAERFGDVTWSPFITLDWERAQTAARESTARYAEGRPIGPLDGVPVPVKDEVHFAGLPTYGGTRWRSAPEEQDGFAARRLRAAGAVLFGKTHTTEWGMSPVGINPHWDMPRNAWDPDRAAGGSSSGTAAAVALGLGPVGLGSDGGGSIRIPSSLQGLYGLKPTFSRVGRGGDVFGVGSVAVIGPIGVSTRCLVDFMSAFDEAPDPEDYATAYAPAGAAWPAWDRALGRGVKGARIGVPRALWERADPRIVEACEAAVVALCERGAKRVDIEVPFADLAHAIGVLSIGPETAAGLASAEPDHGDDAGGELQLQLKLIGAVTSQEYLRAQRVRAALRRRAAEALKRVDVIALPTTATPAPVYLRSENRVHVADDDAVRDMCAFAFLANLTGLPAGTAPIGTVDGLPVGMQFVGDAWDEASVIALLAECERAGIARCDAPDAALAPLGELPSQS